MVNQKKLIIFTHGGGRFVNQIFSYAHLIGFIEEHKEEYDLINIAFWDYAPLLKMTAENRACVFPPRNNNFLMVKELIEKVKKFNPKLGTKIQDDIWVEVLHNWGQVYPEAQSVLANDILKKKNIPGERLEYLELSERESVEILGRKKTTVLGGWGVKSWVLFEKHEAAIREALAVVPRYGEIGKEYVGNLRKKYEVLVGVLIRQTDYRSYLGGPYFFETEQYVRWMEQVKELFGSSVGFLVASDEKQDVEKFSHLNVHFATGMAVGKGHYVENLVELSCCDLVMTPPSTFGVWGAFLGNVPVLPLCEVSQVMDKKDILPHHIFDAVRHPVMSIAVK